MKRYLAAMAALLFAFPAMAERRHGLAMHGEPRHDETFSGMAYVNRDAPKGGVLVLGAQGSFDSLNPFVVTGVAAAGVSELVFQSLMARSLDEPFSLYGLLAESVETPDDRSHVIFTLRPEARFSDGQPVTVDDVIFTHALLRDKGRPNHRSYYSKVTKVERIGERGVKFTFADGGDREMPLIMGLMPILPKHRIAPDAFERSSLEPMIGSGPYMVAAVDPGRSITLRRNPDYWGRDLPFSRGLHNFDELRYDYYLDAVSMFEAFKKGLYDVHIENDPARWANEYDFPAAQEGRVVRELIDAGIPAGMTGFVFNTRREVFADPRVRRAMILMFDFAWFNQNLYYGLYARTDSYFARSELSASGRPADERERALLAAFPDAVRPDIMEGRPHLPPGDGDGYNRSLARQAIALFQAAGYEIRDGRMVKAATGKPVVIEMLAATREQERLFLTYGQALERIGVGIVLRQADSAQYQRRKVEFDFDVIQNTWPASLSPGNEQNFRWSMAAADTQGSFNYPGVKNPAVDAMIAAILAARTREDFVSAVRALDRVLMSGDYVMPLFHAPQQWAAYWRPLRRPENTALYGFRVETMWRDGADATTPGQ